MGFVSDLKLVCRVTVITPLHYGIPRQGMSSSRVLAASVPREVRTVAGNPGRLATPTPRPVFTAAYKELCTRIWIELELLAQVKSDSPQDLAMSTAILRLELIVLVDSCRSPRWHDMLSEQQRESLCSVLTDVLAALYVDCEYLHTGIAAAQDRVLDELQPDSESGRRSSLVAVDELIRLIEAQAAARAAGTGRNTQHTTD